MRTWLIITGCSLVCLGGCRTLKSKETVQLNRDGPSLSCSEKALSKSLAHYGQGLIYDAIDQTDSTRTISEMRLALDYAPDNHDLHTRVAVIALKREMPQTAVEALEESYRHDRKSYQRCMNLATVYQVAGETDNAISQYKKTLRIKDTEAAVYVALARLYFLSDKDEEAFKTLKKGRKHSEDPALIQFYLYEQSKQFLAKNELKRAIAGFKALALWDEAKRPQLYQLIGEIFIAQNNAPDAADILYKATQLPSPIPANFITLAAIYLQYDINKGLNVLKAAERQFPDDKDVLFALGCLYSDLEDYPKAIPLFEAAKTNAALAATNTLGAPVLSQDFYLYHGAAYERTGNIKKAEEIFEECLQIYPDSHHILNYQAYMWAEAGTNLDKALHYINRALKLKPVNPAYIDTLGWIYFKQKKYDEALRYIKKARKLIGPDPEILHHLGDIYYALDDTQQAVANWKRSYRLDPGNKIVAHKLVEQGINLSLININKTDILPQPSK